MADATSGNGGRARWADYGFVFLSDLVILLGSVLVFRLADRFLGQDGFSQYVLVRRALALATPVLFLGLGVALPRQVALAASRSGESPFPDFLASALMLGLAVAAGVAIANAFPGATAHLVFGDAALAPVVPPMSLMLAGLCLSGLCYAYFRGRMQFGRGSALNAFAAGLIPAAAFWLAGRSLESVLWVTGLAVSGVSLVALASIPLGARLDFGGLGGRARALLTYGLPRVPGDFALGGLLGAPAILAAHFAGLREAGMVGFGCTLVGLGGSVMNPVGTILLPEASRMLAAGRRAELRRHVHRLLWVGLGLAAAGTALALLGMELGIRLYLGAGYVQSANTVRVVVLAAPAYVVYACLRSLIDAAHRKAVNAQNCYAALLVFAAVAFGGQLLFGGLGPVLAGFLAGTYVLGALTWVRAERILASAGEAPALED